MQWVRKRRRVILFVFTLGAVIAMTFGFLKRIGIDPLGPADESSEESSEER